MTSIMKSKITKLTSKKTSQKQLDVINSITKCVLREQLCLCGIQMSLLQKHTDFLISKAHGIPLLVYAHAN